jgi:hypothetical protein
MACSPSGGPEPACLASIAAGISASGRVWSWMCSAQQSPLRDPPCAPSYERLPRRCACRVRRGRPAAQLQRLQCPCAQLHAGGVVPALRGPHLRTHSSAIASVRSLVPPGQERPSIAEINRSVSRSVRADTDSICAVTAESRGSGAIGPLSARLRAGMMFARPRGASPW